jgi:hypothetical protein
MQEIKHYKFNIDQLDISITEIEEYGHIPDNMPSYHQFLKTELATLNNTASMEGGCVIVEASAFDEHLVVGDTIFHTGKQVSQFYKGLSHVAVFVCTAGPEITDRAAELNQKGDLVESYLLDILGSVLVEKAMDKMQHLLKSDMKLNEMEISNRYSPGYCNWNVSEQKLLFDFFPANFCNVSLSESCLMQPIKSVSGIIGIGKQVKYHKHVCQLCNSLNCIYRNSTNKF